MAFEIQDRWQGTDLDDPANGRSRHPEPRRSFTDGQERLRFALHHRDDPGERHNGLPVVHLLREGEHPAMAPAPRPPEAAEVAPGYASEIPVRLERQLEDFLAANPGLVEPGLILFQDEDERPGQQYPTDVGVIDLLCRRPSGELLVVELKRLRVSDVVVGRPRVRESAHARRA